MFVQQALRSVWQQITAIFSLFNFYSILRLAKRSILTHWRIFPLRDSHETKLYRKTLLMLLCGQWKLTFAGDFWAYDKNGMILLIFLILFDVYSRTAGLILRGFFALSVLSQFFRNSKNTQKVSL